MNSLYISINILLHHLTVAHHFTSFIPQPFSPLLLHFFTEKPFVLHVFRCKNHGFHPGFSQHFPDLSQDSTGRLPGNGPRSLSCSVHGCWRAAPHGRRSGIAPRVDSPGRPEKRWRLWNGGTLGPTMWGPQDS